MPSQTLTRTFIRKQDIRQEETQAHETVREALINCIIHKDVNSMGNIVVERTDTALTFMNPGMMLVSRQQYFEGGEVFVAIPYRKRCSYCSDGLRRQEVVSIK